MKPVKTMHIRMTFVESILGTMPNNPDIYRAFIGSKSPDAATVEDEVRSLGADAVAENQMTVFPALDDGTPFLYDYQIKGFFKGACGHLRSVPGSESSKLKAYKKIIDGHIFPKPRKIIFHDVEEIGECQRPLRAQTAQGERVSLAMSEEIPAGAWIQFDVELFDAKEYEYVVEWLDFAIYNGIGQWRNASHGRAIWEELDDNGKVIGGNSEEYYRSLAV